MTKTSQDTNSIPEAQVVYLRSGIRRAAELSLKADVQAARARSQLHEKIVSAYGAIRMKDIVRASGLTRQRIHQILDERRQHDADV